MNSHENPILLLLPAHTSVAEGITTLLADADVRHVHYPALWFLDDTGVDLAAALPKTRAIDASTLPTVVDALHRICNEEALRALVLRRWREVDERVRDYYLKRSTLQSFAAIFKFGTPSIERDPPPEFRHDRIYENPFSIAYRIARGDEARNIRAPAEEATLSYHPFDPQGATARTEAGLEAGTGAVLEIFAYAQGRARHRELAERVARSQPGWQVHDPASAT